MPVFNSEKFIYQAIQSILDQTFQDFELIITDDGSTDNSLSIIETFNDKRIKLIKNTSNLGLTASRNDAINISNGEYIAFLDSDDISRQDRLEKQIAFLENNKEFGMIDKALGRWGATVNLAR
jgi:glycosyltransferase involved in cell wall biosynthesis